MTHSIRLGFRLNTDDMGKIECFERSMSNAIMPGYVFLILSEYQCDNEQSYITYDEYTMHAICCEIIAS